MEDKTIQILRSTLEQTPERWESRQQLAELLWARGDIQGTSDVLSGAPQWPSDESQSRVCRQRIRPYQSGLLERSLRGGSSSAIRATPVRHAALARLYMEAGDRETSHEHYLAANAIDPRSSSLTSAKWLLGEAAPVVEETANQYRGAAGGSRWIHRAEPPR